MNQDLVGLLIFLLFAASALLKIWRDRRPAPEPAAPNEPRPAAVVEGDAIAPEPAHRYTPMAVRPDRTASPPVRARSSLTRRPGSAVPSPRQAMVALAVYGPCRAEEPYPLWRR